MSVVVPKPRWYAITIERVLVLLLLVVGFLFLSDQYDWFAFNQRKGWTVLIAVVVVAVVLLLTSLWATLSWVTSRWTKCKPFQFGLRPALLVVVVVAIVCGWFASAWDNAQTQQKALQGIKGIVFRSETNSETRAPNETPRWLTQLLGEDFFSDVVEIHLSDLGVSDVILPDGQVLYFSNGEQVEFPSKKLAPLLLLPKLKKVILMNIYPDSQEVKSLKARGVEVELFMAW